jgi:4-alpha-glucanotransferase
MAIKHQQDGKSWQDWDEPLKKRSKAALEKAREELADRIGFVCFQQFKFEQQWESLKAYINGKKIKVIGDLPFYMALDSADVWSHPEAFQMDKNLQPTAVAGCPPDAFSATGQLWGNPLYDWTKLKKSGYAWWMQRIRRNQEFYDVIRIDHFHGFAEYYAVPYGEESALKGTMKKGPGMDFFNALKEQMGEIPMIAEDLGTVTEENTKLLKDSGLPGMKVLQFAFTSWNSVYVTHRHEKNCVVYTGTHDNTTSRAWIEEINDGERSYVRRYINSIYTDYGQFVWDFIREAYRSVADLCIIPIQDYLVKGKEARMNCPGVADGNWQWRVLPDFLSPELAESIRQLADVYQRMPS